MWLHHSFQMGSNRQLVKRCHVFQNFTSTDKWTWFSRYQLDDALKASLWMGDGRIFKVGKYTYHRPMISVMGVPSQLGTPSSWIPTAEAQVGDKWRDLSQGPNFGWPTDFFGFVSTFVLFVGINDRGFRFRCGLGFCVFSLSGKNRWTEHLYHWVYVEHRNLAKWVGCTLKVIYPLEDFKELAPKNRSKPKKACGF